MNFFSSDKSSNGFCRYFSVSGCTNFNVPPYFWYLSMKAYILFQINSNYAAKLVATISKHNHKIHFLDWSFAVCLILEDFILTIEVFRSFRKKAGKAVALWRDSMVDFEPLKFSFYFVSTFSNSNEVYRLCSMRVKSFKKL